MGNRTNTDAPADVPNDQPTREASSSQTFVKKKRGLSRAPVEQEPGTRAQTSSQRTRRLKNSTPTKGIKKREHWDRKPRPAGAVEKSTLTKLSRPLPGRTRRPEQQGTGTLAHDKPTAQRPAIGRKSPC